MIHEIFEASVRVSNRNRCFDFRSESIVNQQERYSGPGNVAFHNFVVLVDGEGDVATAT